LTYPCYAGSRRATERPRSRGPTVDAATKERKGDEGLDTRPESSDEDPETSPQGFALSAVSFSSALGGQAHTLNGTQEELS
jgi:hypothetical protein